MVFFDRELLELKSCYASPNEQANNFTRGTVSLWKYLDIRNFFIPMKIREHLKNRCKTFVFKSHQRSLCTLFWHFLSYSLIIWTFSVSSHVFPWAHEYWDILCKYPYWVRMWENKDQKNIKFGYFSGSN